MRSGETLVLPLSSRRRLAGFGTLFIAAGLLLLSGPRDAGAGLFCLAFGALAAVAAATPAGRATLRLSSEGLAGESWWRARFYRWSDVGAFRVTEIRARGVAGCRFVSFDLTGPGDESRGLPGFARSLAGVDAALPSTGGARATQLAALLNQWRARYATSGSQSDL